MLITLSLSIVLAAGAWPATAPNAPQDAPVTPWSMDDLFGESRLRADTASGILWMPDGESFLFRRVQDGAMRLFEHAVADGEERLVLDWKETLDGLREQRDWSAPPMDDTNRTGRFSFTPRLSPDGRSILGTVAGDLYLIDLESGAARFLTEGPEPELFFRFRPDAQAIGFTRGGDLYTLDLTSGEETRLTDRGENETLLNGVADWVYEEELDLRQSWWWAPGGQQLAYLQFDVTPVSIFPITDEMEPVAALERQRYPKTGSANARVRLGVLDPASGETTWVASGDAPEGYLVDAGWIDDGRLWYLWLNRDQTRLELREVAVGEGEPQTRLLASERDERWVAVGPDPIFLDDGSFLWTSERDGWRHIYRFAADGGERWLTRGEWSVGSMSLLGEEAAIFTSSELGATEQHVYRVDLDGENKRMLSKTAGWHSANPSPAGNAWLDSWSALTTPPRIELAKAEDGQRLRTVDEGTIPGLAERPFGESRFAQLELPDGQSVWTRTLLPPDFDPEREYPAVIYVYGGPGAQVVRNRWGGSRGYYQRYLAQQGAVVFSLDNRGSGGRGREFARQLYRQLGSLEIEDQEFGARWLAEQPWIDGQRIGIYGGSYGGFMTLNCLMRAPDVFRAGVAYAPVTDFRFYDTIYTERYMDTPADNAEGYSAGAPLGVAEGLRDGALLLVHGTMDNNVHLQNTVQMIDRLARAGKEFELMIYPRTRHAMGNSDYRRHFQELSYDFLERKLGLGRPGDQ